MTVDTRYPISQIIPVASPMPILEVILQYLSGNVFFALRLGNLHSRKCFLSRDVGSTVVSCVLIWIDDLLVYATNFDELLQALEKVFERLEEFGIKLNPLKTDPCALIISWRVRKISNDGITYDSDFFQRFLDLSEPKIASDLQKFLAVVNWMRSSIPGFAKTAARLQGLLKTAQIAMKSAKSSKLLGFKFNFDEWTMEHGEVFSQIKTSIQHSEQIFSHMEAKDHGKGELSQSSQSSRQSTAEKDFAWPNLNEIRAA